MRAILFIHRYLAVAVGLLMTLWCLSGFVMMYQGFPSLTGAERLQGLEPLRLADCCNLDALPAANEPVQTFRVEMLRGEPVLRLGGGLGRREAATAGVVWLRSGEPVQALVEAEILDVATGFGRGLGIAGLPHDLGHVEIDQWTLQSARRNQPVHRVAFDDDAGSELYLNGATGEVFQDTNRRERILTWLGAIPHWLYPTMLRQNGPLWTQIVIWTSIIGTFLAATGLYVGISRLKRRKKDGKLASPYRGWWYWHHMLGLVFGVLTLSWVFSGLMTMNPWGALDSRGTGTELRGEIAGVATWADVRRFLSGATATVGSGGFVQLRGSVFNNRLYVVASRADGSEVRFAADGTAAEIGDREVEAVIARLPHKTFDRLTTEDSYYYGHKGDVDLPVYRVVLDDAEETLLYINPATGEFRALDSNARWSRWVRRGLHGFDFAGLRTRPVWDVVVILLLAGVTAVCVTGTWMACKRVKFDWQRLKARIGRRDYGGMPETSS